MDGILPCYIILVQIQYERKNFEKLLWTVATYILFLDFCSPTDTTGEAAFGLELSFVKMLDVEWGQGALFFSHESFPLIFAKTSF